jgi:Flp pilus assembly protein TadG
MHLTQFGRRLAACRRAVSVVEFGLIMPVLMTLGLGMVELANMALTYMRVSQIAITIADNASRAKQAFSTSGAVMREFDVNEAFNQASTQYPGLDIWGQGRVVLSSLEYNAATTKQYIHWQRCRGALTDGSKYGVQGTGKATAFAGMGPASYVVAADPNAAIMFVEVYYQYRPIFFKLGAASSPKIYRTAALYVRDDRDLTGGPGANGEGIANPAPAATKATC